jgi:putative phage-type endonuclease
METLQAATVKEVEIAVDRDQWLEQRKGYIGASDVGTLLGLTTWGSPYELWARATGKLPSKDFDTERMAWGRRLEAAIALGIAEDSGFACYQPSVMWQDTQLRASATLDYIIPEPAGRILDELPNATGRGVFEIKNVDGIIASQKWTDGEPPANYLVQLQQQLMLSGCTWGAIGGLVGGNTGHLFVYERHEPTIARIHEAISEFWQRVERNDPYPIDDSFATLDAVKQQHPKDNGEMLDKTDCDELYMWAEEYKAAASDASSANARKRKAQANLMASLGDAKTMALKGYNVTTSLVEKDGHFVSASSYRRFSIKAANKGK